MADIAFSFRAEASLPASASDLDDIGGGNEEGAPSEPAWMLLDDASLELLRAEAIVELLASEMEASRHQLFAAQIAGEFLRAASELVSQALEMVRVPKPRNGSQQEQPVHQAAAGR
jgi:hypothetical protein